MQLASHKTEAGELWGDVSTGSFRPIVPAQLRQLVFNSLHGAAHPGIKATRRLISTRFVWPGLAAEVSRWAKECLACQRAKVHRHVHIQPEKIPVPARRFQHIHVDLVGPLPVSGGFTHALTIVDRSSRWVEAVPLASTKAADCATALFSNWISRFGVPEHLTSDRGPQFVSSLWAAVCKLLNISHHQTAAYHPQANGMVERVNRRFKEALRARLVDLNWVSELPWVLLGLRATPAEASNLSAAEAVYGAPLVVPGQFLGEAEPPAKQFFEDLRMAMSGFSPAAVTHNTPSKLQHLADLPAELAQAEFVLVRRDAAGRSAGTVLAPAYDGPFKVLQRSRTNFRLQLPRRQDVVSTSRLKAAWLPANVAAALFKPVTKRVSFRTRVAVIPAAGHRTAALSWGGVL